MPTTQKITRYGRTLRGDIHTQVATLNVNMTWGWGWGLLILTLELQQNDIILILL